jgi:pantoate kinase
VPAAFAPSAITNFFEIRYDGSPGPIGATGGGYILSKGTTSTAKLVRGRGVATRVNGDRAYDARTTRRAVGLLLSHLGRLDAGVTVDQWVDTPIGSGFGASAAAATSAVYSVAPALGVRKQKKELATFAHKAEILEQTGLGTVSAIYDSIGAGAIAVPGEPGVARFVAVRVPKDTRIVTAYFAPYDKKDALSSPAMREKINRLGHVALQRFLSDRRLDNLATEGEAFSKGLGLESPEVKKAIRTAKAAGASHASQNMIGYSVHSLVDADRASRVSKVLKALGSGVRVDVFEVGHARAGVLAPSRR